MRQLSIVFFALIVLGLGLIWRVLVSRSTNLRLHSSGHIPRAPEIAGPPVKPPLLVPVEGTVPLRPIAPSLSEKKKILAALLSKKLTARMTKLATTVHPSSLYNLRFGDDTSFRTLVKETQDLLGEEYSSTVRGLIEDFQSPAYKSVLILMLGTARCSDAIPLLKSALADGQSYEVMSAAAYSLGIMNHEDAFSFLSGYYSTLRGQGYAADLKNLRSVVESGLAANGEKAIPLLLEAARAELGAELGAEAGLDPYASHLGYADRWISFLHLESMSAKMKELIESETDPRIRFTLLAGLTKNKLPECYEYLSVLCRGTKDAVLHANILEAVVSTVFEGDEGISRVPGPIRDSLASLLQPLAPLALKSLNNAETLLALACRLDSDTSRQWMDAFLKQDLNALYGDMTWELKKTAAFSFAAMKDGNRNLEELLKSVSSPDERARLIAQYYRNLNYDLSIQDASQVRMLAGALRAPNSENPDFGFVLTALRRASTEKEVVLQSFKNAYDESPPTWRVKILEAAGALGSDSIPFLEGVMKGADGLVMRAEAARQLLQVSSDADLKSRLFSSLSSLLAPVEKVSGDVFYALGRGTYVYADLVRDYYSRFGTSADIPTLQVIPQLVTFDSRVPEAWTDAYRNRLLTQCQQARDAILLREQVR